MTAADVHAAAMTACRDAGATCATCRWWTPIRHAYADSWGTCARGELVLCDDRGFNVLSHDPDPMSTEHCHTCAEWQAATDAETAGEAPESPGEPRKRSRGTLTTPETEKRT